MYQQMKFHQNAIVTLAKNAEVSVEEEEDEVAVDHSDR